MKCLRAASFCGISQKALKSRDTYFVWLGVYIAMSQNWQG